MTCTGLTCSGWTQISGQFAQQPTLIWDEYLAQYVLTGVASNGSIWRSTFDVGGNFNNDWVQLPGNTPSPVAAASGDLFESHVWYSSTSADTTIGSSCTNYSGGQITVTPPRNGIVYVEADVNLNIHHTNTTLDEGYLYIGTSPTDCASDYFIEFNVPYDYPSAYALLPIHIGEGFLVTGGTSYTFYLNGLMTSGQDAGDGFYWGRMKAVFYPY